jgi:hypothetical protein
MKIFWAWQYDLPGKISRHFIRGALEEAIAQINQIKGIDEPDEAFQTGAVHLDYGRKGLKGSPDLAIEILKKIDAAAVFVGDVTPVGKGPAYKTDDGKESDGKPLMNPNVAIELGYALKTLTTENVLMVMNNYYGRRDDMPFDLGHKGGPILYRLSPTASRQEIDAERKKLVSVLIEALQAYVPRTAPLPFPALKPQIGEGIYFKEGEILAEDKNSRDKHKYVMPFRSVMWLRVLPHAPLEMPISQHLLMNNAGRFGTFGVPAGGEPLRENDYGTCFFTPAGPTANIDSITQYTRDGEIWGINADILRQGERGSRSTLMTLPMENLFITQLDLYMEFMRLVANAPLPIDLEAGIEGVKGRIVAHNGMIVGDGGVMHHDRVTHRGRLRAFDKAEQLAFLLEFFRKVNAGSGVPRPNGLYGRG